MEADASILGLVRWHEASKKGFVEMRFHSLLSSE